MKLANRIRELPPYLFADIDKKKAELRRQGKDLVDLGIGDPDLPTPAHIVAAMQAAAAEPKYHRYPSYEGMAAFREAAVAWYGRRFDVKLDAARECCALIGSKEGIAHFPVAFVDPGDLVLVPDPGYPVYATWTRFVGGEVYPMPLRRENGFLPDLDAIPAEIAKRAKLMWINYPNNPTAALATRDFYKRVVDFAKRHDIIVASDVAYSEIYFDGVEPPPSFLGVDGAGEVGIEFQSLSKTYNMTGWRIGFAVGNAELVGGLGKVKTNTDSGAFEAVQAAAVAALSSSQDCVAESRRIYGERRAALCDPLVQAGFEVLVPKATFYVLMATPKGVTSAALVGKFLDAGVVATPATGFGAHGEGFVRLTLCADKARLAEAARRIVACGL